MEPENQTINKGADMNTSGAGVSGIASMKEKIQKLFEEKPAVVAIAIVVIGALALFMFISGTSGPATEVVPVPTVPVTSVPTLPASDSKAIFTPEQKAKIEAQSVADEQVGTREIEIKTKYPWYIKMPMRSEIYFVYFEPNEAVFVGHLFTQDGDDLDAIKAEIKSRLKITYKVPVEDYAFEWQVVPR